MGTYSFTDFGKNGACNKQGSLDISKKGFIASTPQDRRGRVITEKNADTYLVIP
jgi:hypothetical protein